MSVQIPINLGMNCQHTDTPDDKGGKQATANRVVTEPWVTMINQITIYILASKTKKSSQFRLIVPQIDICLLFTRMTITMGTE